MRPLGVLLTLTCAMLTLAAATGFGQSLGEIARKEEARRKAIAKPGKVYTNADLKPTAQPLPGGAAAPAETAPPLPTATPPGDPAKQAAAQQAPGAAAPPEAAEPAKDEAWWRKRITDARADLTRADVLIAALESRVNALLTDFTARDDPAQRAVIARERQAALGELARMKDERAAKAKAITDIEEEARQAGVPPGWLR
ncbi:MAG: hypothetical protein ACE148_01305 [Vicinamibacterales bacterium]